MLGLIPAPARLLPVEGAGHDLGVDRRPTASIADVVVEAFLTLMHEARPR